MFFRMLRGALTRRGNRHLMIALTVALGACVATSMLSVMFNVGDKVNQELKSYGANIVVRPQGAAVLDDLYNTGEAAEAHSYLREDELGNSKTIFWTYNILDFAPLLNVSATDASGEHVPTTGTWFSHHLELATGESVETGLDRLRGWWGLEGAWPADEGAPADRTGPPAPSPATRPSRPASPAGPRAGSYTPLRAHETGLDIVCHLLL